MATWCPECREKLTKVLPAKAKDPEVAIITINTEKDKGRVQKYIGDEKIEFPVFFDESRELRKSLKIFAVPAWAVYENSKTGEPSKLIQSGSAFDLEAINNALGKKYF